MLTLYSYPTLFGVADNNGYGLKVYAFLKLAGVPFIHEHIFDASAAPRGQLPYIVDDGETIGDSEAIIAHLIRQKSLSINSALTTSQRDTDLLITRMLDDLYWVMSYSRWKDDRYFPAFRDALKREHPRLMDESLDKAREYNFQRYYFQGIGRYSPEDAYTRGLADLGVLARLTPRPAMCTVTNRPASMLASTASSPTSTSMTSIRHSSSASRRIRNSCATARRLRDS